MVLCDILYQCHVNHKLTDNQVVLSFPWKRESRPGTR